MLSSKKPICLGIALSGGGYRAFLNGAGMLAALDDRSYNSSLPGHLGGLLQGATYLAGVSGGSWLVMSLIMSDFQPLVKLRKEWDLSEPLLEGVPNVNQMDVNRNDVQVLPSDFKDDDVGFYDMLNRIGKRDYVAPIDDPFQAFYESNEKIFCAEEQSGQQKLVKRDVQVLEGSPKSDDAWLNGFRTFFRDLFKKKEDPTKFTTNVLNSIEISSNMSLKAMKRTFNFYKNLHLEVRSKKISGFSVSFTDYWGRALSRRVFPKAARSPNLTFSSVTKLESFKSFEAPLPIILSDLRTPGIEQSPINSNIFEFTPFEFGSWDTNLFVNLKYLGSLLYDGKPIFHLSNQTICFTNFDNSGFITGTSSSLFNNIFIYVWQLAAKSSRNNYRAIRAVLNTFGLTSVQESKRHPDYALYAPNPFYRYNTTNPNSKKLYDTKTLYMVDGGEDGQNIPYVPFLQKDRAVDVIFSYDSTADREGWPNGTIIAATAMRFNNSLHEGTAITLGNDAKVINRFPNIPPVEIFIAKGLDKRPVFFGCHLENYGTRDDEEPDLMTVNDYLPPIIGYYANAEVSYLGNTSTFKLTYENDEVSQIIENSYNVMTYGNSSTDPEYHRCIGCILIKREYDRKERGLSLINDLQIPIFCKKCFSDYCYN